MLFTLGVGMLGVGCEKFFAEGSDVAAYDGRHSFDITRVLQHYAKLGLDFSVAHPLASGGG